ncbi:MAG TPA: ATP-binding cassette domain-containing protein [Verrucomicrobiales bacterium]|nr:ATP-binding cassette domain-containing protein [Verrucomicrobiales bacterium]
MRLFIDGVALQNLNLLLAAVFYCLCLVRVHIGLTLACLAFLPVLWILVTLFARWLRRDYLESRRRVDRVVEQVSFRFRPENTVLHSIDLDVREGERIAIVGPTGAGQSALLHLIPRFYDPDAGRILLDGRDLREWKLENVRRQVGLVFQELLGIRFSKPGLPACPEARVGGVGGPE